MTTLTEEQAERFYKLFIPLLDYVNQKYKIEKAFYGMTSQRGLPADVVFNISSKLWENPLIIDEYLERCAEEIPEADAKIVKSWKQVKCGKYIVDRHLNKGSVLVSLEDESVYVVKGIYSDWRELLWDGPVPQIVKATIIPFEDSIITDGLVMPYNVLLGQDMADWSKQLYLNAKKEGKLICSMK